MNERADVFVNMLYRAKTLLEQDVLTTSDYIQEVEKAAFEFDKHFRTVNLTCHMAMDFISGAGLYDQFEDFVKFLQNQAPDEEPVESPKLTRIK